MICPTHNPECYACRLRAKGVNLSSSASPTARARRPFRRKVNCSWEAGIVGERRPDGSFMPVLGPDGSALHVKEYAENRRAVDEGVRRARQLTPERT